MKVLIFGGDGMLGHQLLRHLRTRYEVRATLHQPLEAYPQALFKGVAVGGIDVRDEDAVRSVIGTFRPDAVVNAVGVVKPSGDAAAEAMGEELNARFPQRLAALCRDAGAYLVHYSTDCVFSGRKGGYTEADTPDPVDPYGRSKLRGEVTGEGCISVRTSMIGPELSRKSGLLEWFLAQKERTLGFRRAVFSGLTTPEQARVVERILERRPRKSGLYHVSGDAINKFDLLRMIARHFGLSTMLEPDDALVIDRSLDSMRFCADFGYQAPSWDEMIGELASLCQ